jgi:hypothetical protein
MLKFIFVNETKSFANDTRVRPAARPLVFEKGTFYIIETTLVVRCRVSPV